MIKFTIAGNPIPYTRTTQKGKFGSPQWQRYAEYKAKIVASFLDSVSDASEKRNYWNNYQVYGKPVYSQTITYVLSIAYFRNKQHGDSDNINKGVLDSLFVNDKFVVGAFNYHYDSVNPRLEVTVCDNAGDWKSVLRQVNW